MVHPAHPPGPLPTLRFRYRFMWGGPEWSVSGANIQLYAAGTQGMGSSATPLLAHPVATDSSGNLTITEAYACSSPTSQVYLVASGGNPGLASGTNN
jgi:trimeric autotransporter adhesin